MAARRRSSTRFALRWDDLVLEEAVGEGAFGAVWRASHPSGRQFAVKILKGVDTETRLDAIKESRLLRAVKHENILRFYGLFAKGTELKIVTELVDGGTLLEYLLCDDIALPWDWRVAILLRIARGMEALHAVSIIHRDLKSENCLVSIDADDSGMPILSRVVVADLGLARWSRDGKAKKMTVAGTPWIMSPELLKGEAYDAAVDVFSFGVVCAEVMLRLPADDVPRAADFGLAVDDLRAMLPESCPEALMDLCCACCRMEASERPSFEAIVKELELLYAECSADDGRLVVLSGERPRAFTDVSVEGEVEDEAGGSGGEEPEGA